jgi:hypothetical protein
MATPPDLSRTTLPHGVGNETENSPTASVMRGRGGGWQALGFVGTWVAAFVGGCALLGVVLPARELPPVVRERVTHLKRHGGDYGAIFFGSSRVESHVMPAVFEQDLAHQGRRIESFNAGVAGMYPPQDGWLVEKVLALKGVRPRWVFVEVQTLQTTLPRANRDSLQLLSWHDWPRYWLLCQRFVTTRDRRRWQDRVEEIWGRWPEFCDHTTLFVRCFTNLGRGSEILKRTPGGEAPETMDWRTMGESGDGWVPDTHIPDKTEVAGIEADLAKRRHLPAVKENADAVSRKALAILCRRINDAGATPVLIVPPTPRGTYFCPVPLPLPNVIVLDFSDPRKFPDLYETPYRADPVHLNAEGAELFSHLLAAEFLKATADRR